jgi:hypothetical protein
MNLPLLFVLVALLHQAASFQPVGITRNSQSRSTAASRGVKMMIPLETASTLVPAILARVAPTEAQTSFFFFFFAGSGALGIGGAQVPKILDEFKEIGELSGDPSAGGKSFELNAVESFGYGDIKEEDVKNILSCFPTVAEIQAKGNGKSYLAQKGYLERAGYEKAMAENLMKLERPVNRLAMYMVFTALTGGGSAVVCSPQAVYEKVPQWKGEGGLDALRQELSATQSKRIGAYSFFAFLIFLVLDLIVETGVNGYFPDSGFASFILKG